jgi:hypothetical protein
MGRLVKKPTDGRALIPSARETVSQSKKFVIVMLSKAKHLAFSRCYEDEILRLRIIYDIATQSPTGRTKVGVMV